MKFLSLSVVNRFVLIVLGTLLIAKLSRIAFYDGPAEQLGGIDVVIALAIAVAITGGWLRRSPPTA